MNRSAALLLLLLIGCSDSSDVPGDLSADDYAVMAEAGKYLFDLGNAECAVYESTQWIRVQEMPVENEDMSEYMRQDFVNRNETSSQIEVQLIMDKPCTLVSKSWKPEESENLIYRITISKPGYDASHQLAVVYMEGWCADLCGSGGFVYLSKLRGSWTAVRMGASMIS